MLLDVLNVAVDTQIKYSICSGSCIRIGLQPACVKCSCKQSTIHKLCLQYGPIHLQEPLHMEYCI